MEGVDLETLKIDLNVLLTCKQSQISEVIKSLDKGDIKEAYRQYLLHELAFIKEMEDKLMEKYTYL